MITREGEKQRHIIMIANIWARCLVYVRIAVMANIRKNGSILLLLCLSSVCRHLACQQNVNNLFLIVQNSTLIKRGSCNQGVRSYFQQNIQYREYTVLNAGYRTIAGSR